MTSKNRPRLPYVPALDGIRAIAIILVFLYHEGKLRGGWIGVDIFFTLSGYLITLMLVTEYDAQGSILFFRFFFRRACRLLPAVAVLICAALAFSFYLNDEFHDTAVDALAALFYVEDFRYAFSPGQGTALVHLWSLSVEEQFYFIWPFLLILSLSLFGRKRSLYVVCASIILVITWRFALLSELSPSLYYRIYASFDTRIDELLIGSALALSGYRPGKAIVRPVKLLWPIVIILFTIILVKLDSVTWEGVSSYPLIGAGTAWLIVVATTEENTVLSKLLTFAPLVALGRISYGVYLWHFLIIHEINRRPLTMHLNLLLAFALTLIVSIASYRLIEQPALRFGRRVY
jgi:peptidoglycan/LPS O-acetylase OafA/YrhL